ncbi:MAG: hypothetical protein QGG36_06515 [Pirellulaceae bacterium]|jgi:hypothetical protein|nr:hypothetical protein [Pirellulaceae bacterium]
MLMLALSSVYSPTSWCRLVIRGDGEPEPLSRLLHSPGRPGLSELVIDSALTVAISHTIASSAIELRQLTVRNVKPSDGCLRILAASRALQRGLSTLD